MIWKSRRNGSEEEREPLRDKAASPEPEARPAPAPLSGVGRRVETVLEAAERAAADIRSDAEQWAERHLAETRRRADELVSDRARELSSITEDLLARAKAVAKESDELMRALDTASRRALHLNGTGSSAESSNGSVQIERSRRVSDGARLLATQMAVAGSSRETIASRLKEEFGILDSTPILDEAGL
jgi:hypothetical protein